MIYDSIGNIENYSDQADAIYKAVKFVCGFDPSGEDGTHPIEGEDIFAIVQTVKTASANGRLFEGHRDFIDVQMVLEGSERQDVILLDSTELEGAEEYDREKDAIFYRAGRDFCSITMRPGMFVVYGPEDLHRPCICLGRPEKIRKVCVKIRITPFPVNKCD